jgi:hypothetical protein
MANNETSVAEALERAHAALLEDLHKLEEAAHPASGEVLAELRRRLEATRRHITEHFRFEEQNGYMDAVRKREPRLERTVEQLAQEHRALEQSLEALIGEATVVSGLSEAFREKVRRWVEEVQRHEARENDLVFDAFNLDISAED